MKQPKTALAGACRYLTAGGVIPLIGAIGCLLVQSGPIRAQSSSTSMKSLGQPDTRTLPDSAGKSIHPSASGIVIVVDSTGDGVNMGVGDCDDGTGHCTLRAAIQFANGRNNGSDTISISVNGTITLGLVLPDVAVAVTIVGPGANKVTVTRPSTAAAFSIFNVTAGGIVSFSDITISNGNSGATGTFGGGINYTGTGTLNVGRCTLIGNASNNEGGAIYNKQGTVNVTASTITGNSSANGGGIGNDATSTMNISYCAIGNNFARGAGGGGVYTQGVLNISNSAVYSNVTDQTNGSTGGGLLIASSTANITNCTIWGNAAGVNGGGGIFYNGGSNTTILTNCTITHNSTSSTNRCGGVFNQSTTSGVLIKNTIIAGNMANSGGPDVFGAFTSSGSNLIGDGTGATGANVFHNNVNGDQVGTTASPIDPKLDSGPAQNGGPTLTVALLPGSPAIDGGNDANAPAGDQRNFGRVGTSDIGAFEFGAVLAKAVSLKTHGTATIFSENFDGVTAPALPSNWTATGTPPWTTSTNNPASSPNDAFVNDPTSISDIRLDSPSVFIPASGYHLTFNNSYNLEGSPGNFHDGGVLEVSVNGGAFTDILSAGGAFGAGGYVGTITGSGNPLGGRQGWGGNSFGYLITDVDLSSFAGQTLQFRFRLGADNSAVAAPGWWIDNVAVGTPGSTFDVPLPLNGVVSTLAGLALNAGSTDGTGSAARFSHPRGVAVDGAGNAYVADYDNDTVRKITSAGAVSTLAGQAGSPGSSDGTGNAARFANPWHVAVDNAGNVYVSDYNNDTIRKITPAGAVSTLAGLAGNAGSSDGTGSGARFNLPAGVAVDSAGNVYVGDSGNSTIREITPAGAVSTLAGLAGVTGGSDGTGTGARFNGPAGVAVDSAGNVYVADEGNHTVRKITPAGVVTTIAGLAGNPGTADGTGSVARFFLPHGVAVDGSGTIYVADSENHTIRAVTPTRIVTTLTGLASNPGSSDGPADVARFDSPQGIAVDTGGNLYVSDTVNDTIRVGKPAAQPGTFISSAGASGIECRTGGTTGDHQLMVTFANPVTVTGSPQAQVTSGTGQIGAGGVSNGGHVIVGGVNVTVPLTGITNAQRVVVTLFGVSDGTNTNNVSIPMGVLLGDVNATGRVDGNDVSAVQSRNRQTVNSTNFQYDINLTGRIDGNDVSLTQGQSRTSLP